MANKTSDEIQIKDLDNWKLGLVSYFSKRRMQETALKAAYNVLYDYDAVIRPRGSFNPTSVPDVPIITQRTAAPAVVSTNLITNPSFEVNTAGWGSVRCTLSTDLTNFVYGSRSLKATITSVAGNPAMTYAFTGLIPGQTYTLSAYIKANLNDTPYFYCDELTGMYAEITAASGGWQRISATGVCSSAAGTIEFGVAAATVAVSDIFYLDGVLLEKTATLGTYFDGATTNTISSDYAWTGTANASASTRSVYTVETITPQPLACDFPFKRTDGTEGLLNVFSDGTNGYIYVLKADNTGWTKFDAVTFDITRTVSFAQIAGAVVVGNDDEAFTYYEIATNTVKQLAKVVDPTSIPVATPTGFTGTNALDYYYRVAFGGIGGSTMMSPSVKISSSTIRDTWGDTRNVAISIAGFTLDPNAQNWAVLVAGVTTGTGAPVDSEYFYIADSLPLDQKQFTDTGAVTLLKSAPIENTTEGIKAGYYVNISGRLWAISKGIVYWGGNVGNELYFGSANGSDSYNINPDSAETPMAITLGRDNAGTTCINLLTKTQAGLGAIWDIYATTNSITANGETFSTGTYQFKKREGDDGTDAPFSVIRANNNAYYLSMDGFKSTGVKPNVSGIQSTDIISSAIRDRVLNLTQSNLSKTYAAYFDEMLCWTVAYGSDKNNEIWTYDMLHGGIWSIWRIQADCIFRWASTENESPSLYIRQGNKLLRYYKNSHTHADDSGVFESYIESGLIPFGDSQLEWVHILKNIWQFDQAVGQIELTVNIHAKNGEIIKSNTVPFNEATTVNGQSGWDSIQANSSLQSRGSWSNRNWNETLADLLSFKDPSDKKVDQKVRKNAAYISFAARANTRDTYYELSHLSILFTYIGVGVEFLSQKGVIKI